jgi:Protein of unknown function (DUF3891)
VWGFHEGKPHEVRQRQLASQEIRVLARLPDNGETALGEESMVIGWLPRDQKGGGPSSAWARVEAAQRQTRLPCLLVPQPAHAVLAGELAAGLLAESFGELPPEIVRAIQMHDTGWASSDAQQIQRLRSGGAQASHAVPVSFVSISPRETAEAWIASINSVEALSQIGAIIVSRHFSLLAQHDQAHHQRFLRTEQLRQQKLESSSMAKNEDLERWTAALGFCDLVSLYLVSGLSSEVEFPLAHPASQQAQTAPRVTMQTEGRRLRFTQATFRAGCALSIQALKHPLPTTGARAETLTWEVQ